MDGKINGRDKIYVICITILSVWNTFIAPYLEARHPQPNTRIITGGRELFTTKKLKHYLGKK